MAIHPVRFFLLLLLMGLPACVTTQGEGRGSSLYLGCASGVDCARARPVRGMLGGTSSGAPSGPVGMARAPRGEVGPIELDLLDVDYFHGLLVRAGIPQEQLPENRRSLSPAEAVRLLSAVLSAEVGLNLYPVEADLEIHPDAVMAGVWAPDEGTVGPMLEGAGAAVVDTVTGLVTLVLHPIESLEGLMQLPGAVRTLIQNSPDYWEHFRAMPHGAQVRAVSRLLTNTWPTWEAGAAAMCPERHQPEGLDSGRRPPSP